MKKSLFPLFLRLIWNSAWNKKGIDDFSLVLLFQIIGHSIGIKTAVGAAKQIKFYAQMVESAFFNADRDNPVSQALKASVA